MPFRSICALLAVVPATLVAAGAATEQSDRVVASFLLALGRPPTNTEAAQWSAEPPRSLAELVERHRQHLQADPVARQSVWGAAMRDAFGQPAAEGAAARSASRVDTYAETMQRHVERLETSPVDYEQVVQRAYRFLLRREAYDLELEYWKKHDTFPYVLLVGCIEDWARRNQPGLMVTTGTPTVSVNSRFVTAVRLSPVIAAEAREFAGLAPLTDVAAASGRTVLAAGAESVVSLGRVPIAIVGAED